MLELGSQVSDFHPGPSQGPSRPHLSHQLYTTPEFSLPGDIRTMHKTLAEMNYTQQM